MSKAFTKETDAGDDESALPAGNFPPAQELHHASGLCAVARRIAVKIDESASKVVDIVHWAASNGDRSVNGDHLYGKKGCARSTAIRFLTKRLEIAEVVDPSVHAGSDQIWRHRHLRR